MERAFLPPPPVAALLARIGSLTSAAGIRAYVVGGAVRDVLVGRAVHDVDLAVAGAAHAFARTVADAFGGHFVMLDEERDVARVVLDDAEIRTIDVGALQGSFEDDILRRDFTVDALAVPLGGGNVIDLVGGLADLDARSVRAVTPAALEADPLRLLRAARIAAELAFSVEAETAAQVRSIAHRLAEAAPERQRDEFARVFALDRAYEGVLLLDDLRLLDVLLPELATGRGVAQPGEFHAYDVFEHNLRTLQALDAMLAVSPRDGDTAWLRRDLWLALDWCAADLRAWLAGAMSESRSRASLLKIAGLMHDVAKPETRAQKPDGRVSFYGHADAGARTARAVLHRLRFSAAETAFVATLVAEHLRPVQLAQLGEVPTSRALYRFVRDAGEAFPAVLLLALADAAAARGPSLRRAGWRRHVGYMNSLLVRSFGPADTMHPPRILSGHDIMARFGVPEGPLVGELLEAVREAQATGEVRDAAGAEALVARLLEHERKTGPVQRAPKPV